MSETSIKKIKLGIIDLKSHNLFSILQACKNIGYKSSVVNNYSNKLNFDIIILPGVGSFKYAMKYLRQFHLQKKLFEFTLSKNKLLLGICLGMQLLFEKSDEFGKTKGLELIAGNVKKFNKNKLIVPHVGWNNIFTINNFFLPSNVLNKKFYFTHSYYCQPKNKYEINTFTKYGNLKFCSSIKKNNIIGTQFHPEKSGEPGLKILKNISNLI